MKVDPILYLETISDLVKKDLVNPDPLCSGDKLILHDRVFDRWMSGDISVEEYDRILRLGENGDFPHEDAITWEDFNREMERRGLRPEDVLDIVDQGKEKNS